MKKILFYFLLVISFLWIESCGLTDDDNPGWSSNDKELYDQILTTQDEIADDLEGWFQTMDSLDAIEKAYQSFINDENVTSATINSQGIAVQYSNGIRGGLFLNPKDDAGEEGGKSLSGFSGPIKDNGLKSLVNNRKMVFINPHYYERSYFSDQVLNIDATNLARVEIRPVQYYKSTTATLDQFANLAGYGFIQVYSHGFAWPKRNNITDVYLLTGETANETTSKKYWDDLTESNIPIIRVGVENKYFIAPEFISKYNDFSKDTVLFYGGFCYSFLGGWPDLIDSFADGAYLGFDWSVYTFRNANWSVNMISQMSDTSKANPATLGDWMDNPDMEKSYWNERDQRTVHIYYTGDEKLTLWGDTKVRIIALSDDGTPVSKPGEAGVAYPFKCEVVSGVGDLEYIWDIGDGSSPVSASNEVNITWSAEGNYLLKVEVKDKNNNSIGSATANVTIGNPGNDDVLEFVTSCIKVNCNFKAEIQYSPSSLNGSNDIYSHADIEWSGLSFNGTLEENELGNYYKYTISGTLSNDGQTISYESHSESKYVVGNQVLGKTDYTIAVHDYPLSIFDPVGNGFQDPFASYGSIYPGIVDVQQYVTKFEGYEIDDQGITYTVTGVNWDNVTSLSIIFKK